MTDPNEGDERWSATEIAKLEERRMNQEMGRMSVRVFQGAREEGSLWEAFWATAAYWSGLTKTNEASEEEKTDGSD